MGEKYLNQKVRFKCHNGHAVFLKPQSSQNPLELCGDKVLTMECRLELIGSIRPGQCDILRDPSTGGPGPCCIAGPIPCAWSNPSKLSVRGSKALITSSATRCPVQGEIKVFRPTSAAINVNNYTNSLLVPGTKDTNKKNEEQAGSNYNQEEELTEEKTQEISERQSDHESNYTYPYALCNYQTCDKRDTCQYLTSSLDILNDAAILKENLCRDRFEYYIEVCSSIETTRYENAGYITAHHHIIPGNQCLKQMKELVLLANYYHYDINNALNGICLPTMNDVYDSNDMEGKIQIALKAMDALRMQWHKGGHGYLGKLEKVERIARDIDVLLPRPFIDYAQAVMDELTKFRTKLRQNMNCRCQDYDIQAKEFVDCMNHISQRIAKKLDAFYAEPQKSAPFFVSRMAILYAYNLIEQRHQMFAEEYEKEKQ